MLKRLLLLSVWSAVTATTSALEVVGEAPYLENRYRAAWRSTPLATVLKDLERQSAPIVASSGITAAKDRAVTLFDEDRVRLRDTLELLERTQDLHITAEPLRLFVETWTDFRDRKRHLVNLSLRDYGLFVNAPDMSGPNLGFWMSEVNSGGGGFALFGLHSSDHSAGRGPDPNEVVDWFRTIATDADASLRGNGNLHVMVTTEEEQAIRAALTEVQARVVHHTTWRVSFGMLPPGQTLPTGMTTPADAEAVRARLQAPRTLTLAAMNAQRVNAAAAHQQAVIDDLDVVNYQFDPATSRLLTGVAVDLRPVIGAEFIHLSYQLSWVEPQAVATSELTNPPRLKATASSTTTTTTSEPAKDGKTGETPKKEQVTTTTVNNEGGDLRLGTSMTLTKPVLWAWKPRGEVMLPKDRALVFATEHPAGTAVMVLEARP